MANDNDDNNKNNNDSKAAKNADDNSRNIAESSTNNAGNENSADNASQDFKYYPNYSASCIFLQTPNPADTCMLRWCRRRHHCPSNPHHPPKSTIFSSSHGLLLCHEVHKRKPSTYYVGNPFLDIPYKTFHPMTPHHSDTHAVLVANRDGLFEIVCLLPNPTQEGNLDYAVEAYSSFRGTWRTLWNRTYLNNNLDRVVIPNSGTSCKRFGYWLTWLATSRNGVKVLIVDPKRYINPAKYPLFTFLPIPVKAGLNRMKLGRIGTKVALVVVNETISRVELYLINKKDDEDAVWFSYKNFLMVDVDPTMEEEVAVEVVESNRIRCREMPEPIRFESFKMEVLLSVGGGRQVVLWECSRDFERTRVTIVKVEVSSSVAPYVAARGVPHVSTSVVPKISDGLSSGASPSTNLAPKRRKLAR